MNNPYRRIRFPACLRSLAVLIFIGLSFTLAHAQYGPDDEAETLEAMKPKAEAEVVLPPYPKTGDLLPVDTGPTSRLAFAIDAKSLTVSPDHIVRYTVVATSSGGGQNVSYEGINCGSMEFRRYAYGVSGKQWARARRDKWERISSMSQNQLHYSLFTHYFCQGRLVAGKPADILNRIRYNRSLSY